MSAPLKTRRTPALLDRWETALVFRIGEFGESDSVGPDQLPDFRNFPRRFPDGKKAPGQAAVYAFGSVLAFGVIKLYRPFPVRPGDRWPFDPYGVSVPEIVQALDGLPENYAHRVKDSFFAMLGTAIEIALCYPDRLAKLASRIDALDNAALHKMSMDAVQGLDVPDLFEGLYE